MNFRKSRSSRQSGGQVDYTTIAKETELTRPIVKSYLEAVAISHAIRFVLPFHGGGRAEIVSRPKCYAFDTGFVCWERGWDSIRDTDRGELWEHLVLDSLLTKFSPHKIFYRRDKSDREVDSVIRRSEHAVDLVVCKVNPDKLEGRGIRAFRDIYPLGTNYVVSPFIENGYRFTRDGFVFQAVSLAEL